MSKATVTLEGVAITVSNLEKPLWPEDSITKADLMHYFTVIGPWMLHHLQNRPLTVVRYPDGVMAHSFYQKDAPKYAPDWIALYPVASHDGTSITRYILANDLPTLIWLANQGAIEYHPWMSRIERPEFPTYAVIDLDPAEGATFDDAREVASLAKEWLDRIGLAGVPKTSGATGIHIQIPLEPIYPYEVTSRFVGLIGQLMERDLPQKITTERLVRNRPRGTVYVDHLQNLPGKTIVAAFSPRPRAGAPVSCPFDWQQLSSVQPYHFNLKNPVRLLEAAREYTAQLEMKQRLDSAYDMLRVHTHKD